MVDTQVKIGAKIKEAISKAGYSNRDAAKMMKISENALYKIFNKEHINTEILYEVSELFGTPLCNFFDDFGGKQLKVKVEGNKNLTISGETNFFSETDYKSIEKNSENSQFESQYNMMINIVQQKDIIIEDKDRLILEKDRMIEEKERFIQHLISKHPNS